MAAQLNTLVLRSAAAALLLLCCSAVANAQNTKGLKLDHTPGYTFGSNVFGYLRLSTDVCDIKKAIGTSETNPGYLTARQIYTNGKNSKKSDGSIRTLRGMATDSYAGEPTYDMYVRYFGGSDFLDAPIVGAFAGSAPYRTVPQRNQTIVKGIETMLQTVYMLHELDEAAAKIRVRSLSADKGAPHNVDETFAIWAGITPACSLWGSANKRGSEFGTMVDCSSSQVNTAMTNVHRQLYAAATKGDLAAFQRGQQEVVRLITLNGIQSTLKYAELLDKAVAKNDKDAIQDEQAEGAMFFRTIAPFIARVDPAGAKTIQQVLSVGAPLQRSALAIVKPILERNYARLGISRANVGTFGAKQNLAC